MLPGVHEFIKAFERLHPALSLRDYDEWIDFSGIIAILGRSCVF
jgi:hypothetical protein